MKKLLLSIIILLSGTALFAQDCSDLFFSEYVEGSGNNKAFEIYNPTNAVVDLSIYAIKRYSNGSPVATETLVLSGSIEPYGVVVVCNGQEDSVWVPNGQYWSPAVDPALLAIADLTCSGIYPTPFYFNGDDALTLEKTTGDVVDIFGKIGDYPGDNGWNDIPPTYFAGSEFWTSWSKDQTLVKKRTVLKGVSANPEVFMVNMEWDSLPKDTFDSLGMHICDCGVQGIGDNGFSPSFVMYPNPLTGETLTISSSQKMYQVEVLSILGQSILTREDENGLYELQLNGIIEQNGIYLVRILFEDDNVIVEKLIVN